jgi:peptidyl-prolyl cis-trans isomerase SurA
MKKLIFFIFIFYATTSIFAANNYIKKLSLQNSIIAKINNRAITKSELNDRYNFVIITSKINIKNTQDKKILESQILDKMIDEELIRQEAKNLKIESNASELMEAIDEIAFQQKKNSQQLKFFFLNQGLSFENYLKQVESEILWSKIISEVLRSKVKVSEVEIKEFFEQQKFNISVKKFLIAEILISNNQSPIKDNLLLAKKLVEELRNGANFKSILQNFSTGGFDEHEGEIGWVWQSDIDAKIYDAIFKLTKNSFSDPVLLSDGYHIFKILDVKTDTKVEDQDLISARNIIFSRKLQITAKGYLMDVRRKSFIEISN